MFNKVYIVGCGLIGASIGLELVRKQLAREVIGVGRSTANLRIAKRRRAIHRGKRFKTLPEIFQDPELCEAELIVLAMPVVTIEEFLKKIPRWVIAHLRHGAVITDVGSTKKKIVALGTRRIKGPAAFVGAHPIAGTEHSGAAAAVSHLFHDRLTLITPTRRTPRRAQLLIRELWRRLGASVQVLSPERHDALLAETSHLPHMVAFSLIQSLSRDAAGHLIGGGLRDFTRITASDPTMWRDISLHNAHEILRAMRRFEKQWGRLKDALSVRDARQLKRFFAQGNKRRQSLP